MACEQSLAHGLEYIWIDTCCIDKSSSAELSESINSMFAYYEKSNVCYAYLFDVPDHCDVQTASNSEWFKRGWTLQELTAPQNVIFYSQGWVELGGKLAHSKALALITGIDEDILTHEKPLSSLCIAKKMFWAANRVISRVEDVAYCLMGLFNVNMPMIYGEGEKAFVRLQEEIMKETDDESLFVWVDENASPSSSYGLLARSPANFAESGEVVPYHQFEHRELFTKTNKSLRISLPLDQLDGGVWAAAIGCSCLHRGYSILAIHLKQVDGVQSNMELLQHTRVDAHMLHDYQGSWNPRTMYVRQDAHSYYRRYLEHVLQLDMGPDPSQFKKREGGWIIDDICPIVPQSFEAPRLGTVTPPWLPKESKSTFSFQHRRAIEPVVIIFVLRGFDMTAFTLSLVYTRSGFEVYVLPWMNRAEILWIILNGGYNQKQTGIDIDTGKEMLTVDAVTKSYLGKQYHLADIHLFPKKKADK